MSDPLFAALIDPLLLVIDYPEIDPVAFEIGPISVRWYALAYILGLLFAWRYVRRLAENRTGKKPIMGGQQVDDLLLWATLGVVLGGRLGYVIFYRPGDYLEDPAAILQIWSGGMAFHGGLLGVILAIILYSRRHKLNMFSVGDLAACATPVGLFLGRLANFVNGELWGRASDVSWAMVFPRDPLQVPRHPSQLYEAFLEGLLLFALLLFWRRRTNALDRPGELCGIFFMGYGVARFVAEYFRQPDDFLPNDGYLFGFITMGQILSLPLIAAGLWFIWRARSKAAQSGNPGAAPEK